MRRALLLTLLTLGCAPHRPDPPALSADALTAPHLTAPARWPHAREPIPEGLTLVAERVGEDPRGGLVRLTVTNPTDHPLTVAPLRRTGDTIRWRDSLMVVLGEHLVALPACPDRPRAPDEPTALGPGERVDTLVDLHELPRLGPFGVQTLTVSLRLGALHAELPWERGRVRDRRAWRAALLRVDRGACQP